MKRAVLSMMTALELGLPGLGAAWLVLFLVSDWGFDLLVVWDILALVYVVTGWLLLRGELPDGQTPELVEQVGPRWYTSLFALVSSCTGLAGGLVLIASRRAGDDDAILQAVSAITVLLSWLLLHTAFARLYSSAFFADGGLRFPDCEVPQLAEFVYFSFSVGTSFATSDVSIVTSQMRRRVTAHSVVSFFFNAAVVAIAIDWLKG